MAENENVVVNEEPSFGAKLWGGIKERCRKFVVGLKRRPMNIAFVVLVVSSIVNLCILGSLSQLGLQPEYGREMQGLCIFINQLFCILVLLLFLNSFPKREKKPKVVMLVLCFAFMAVLIALDVYLYVMWGNNNAADLARTESLMESDRNSYDTYWNGINSYYPTAMNGLLAHMIIVGVAAVLTATYPLYGKLINMINTKKNIESTELKEGIDTSAEV